MRKRILSILCVLALCLSLLPVTALAVSGDVTYQYYDTDSGEWKTGTISSGDYTSVSSFGTETWEAGWYVINGTDTKYQAAEVTIEGDVYLILYDGCDILGLSQGNGPAINISDNSSLTIYAQSGGSGSLYLKTTADDKTNDVISLGNKSSLNIHGGNIRFEIGTGSSGKGIDVGTGTLNIYGGTIETKYYADIYVPAGGTLNIYGGTITLPTQSKIEAEQGSTVTIEGNVEISGTYSIPDDQKGNLNCILNGTVYGTATLPSSMNYSSTTLNVLAGTTLILPDGTTLNGTINLHGTLKVEGTFYNQGEVFIYGDSTLTGGGTIINQGNGYVDLSSSSGYTSDVTILYKPTVTVTSQSEKGTNVADKNEEVTFTATVTGNNTVGTPTGTVQFKDGDIELGEPQSLDENGTATCTVSANDLGLGDHTITAEYTPETDSSYTANTGSLAFIVVGEVSGIAITAQPTNLTYTTGQTLDLSGLKITVSYKDSEKYTPVLSWGVEGLTASIGGETVTTLYASQHDGQTITITYEGKSATTDALTVNPADQTGFAFTEDSPTTVTYGDGTFTVKAEGGEGTGDVTYAINEGGGDAVSVSETGSVTINHAGTATITATKAADGDYNEATATLEVTVSKADQTGFAFTESSITKTYGEGTFTLSTTGGSGSGTVTYTVTSGDAVSVSGNTVTIEKAGTATITATKAADDNYNEATATLTVTVNKAPLTVSAVTATSRDYNGSNTVAITGVTLDGIVGTDDVSVDTSTLTGTLSSADVGTYSTLTLSGTVNLTGTDKDNYTLTLPTEAVTVTDGVTISPAVISIQSATLKTKTYDGTTAAEVDEVTFAGVPSGQSLALGTDYTATAVFDSADANVSQSGTVTVTLISDNFTFAENEDEATYDSATGTISQLPVVLEWSTQTEFTYNGEEHSVTATIQNVVGNDEVTLTYENNTATNAGEYTATVTLTGTDAANYTLDGVENATLNWRIAGVSIDTATVTLDPSTADYNGSTQAPTVTVTLDGQDLDGDTDYEVSYDPAEVKNAGDYTVTVTGKGNYEGTATATFTIKKADPNIGTVTYSGTETIYESTALNSITLSRSNETVSGTLALDAGQTLLADVSSYNWTFTPNDTANYETVTGTVQLTVQADTLTSLSVQSGPTKTEYVYGNTFDTAGLVLTATYQSGNTKEISAEEITVVTDGFLTCDMTEVTVSYQGMECTVSVTVNKADYSGTKTVSGAVLAGYSGSVALPDIPDGAIYGTAQYTGNDDAVTGLTITGNTLAYEGGSGITKGQTYEITVPVNGGTNYEDYSITVTLIGTDKKVPTGAPALSTTAITYGQSLGTITLSGSMQDGETEVTGTFTWDAPSTKPSAGTYAASWTFTPDKEDLYEQVSGTVTITVNKATPTGAPQYTAITTSGKTLADAGLTTEGGTFSVEGTVAWDLDSATEVTANTAYTWTFTPTDDNNYNSISGSITLYTVSTSGGGGSSSGSSYTVSVPASSSIQGGSIAVSPRSAKKGDTVTITVQPDAGYELEALTVTNASGTELDLTDKGGGQYTFTMPSGSVSVRVSFVPEAQAAVMGFADVAESNWAYDEIAWAYENGYMSGTAAATFNPGGTVTRQQVWMILARMAGENPADMAAARAWAVANGISDGTNPGSAVTRQQLAALLYRYAVLSGYDVSVGESTNILSYTDAAQLSEYAVPAMQWACGAGIINGTGDGSTLSPQGSATRAQLAVMLYRWLA